MNTKKLLLTTGGVLLVFLLLPVLGFGIALLTYVFDFNQWKTDKAEIAAIEYAEKKYEGEFTELGAKYTRQLGEDGQFQVKLRSEQHPDIEFRVYISADLNKATDDYKDHLWTKQGNAWLAPVIQRYYPEAAVQTGLSFEAVQQASLFTERDSFQDVGKAMPGAVTFFAYIYLFQNEVNPEADAQKLFAIWKKMQSAGFSKADMNVSYLPLQYRSNFKKHLHKAAHRAELSTEQPVQSASDIVPLLREQ